MSALAFDLAWKSAVVTALVLAVAALLRSRSAGERVAVLRLGMVVVLALPLLATAAPALRVELPALVRSAPVAGPAPNATPRPGPVPNVAPIPGPSADLAQVRSVAPVAAPHPAALPHISPLAVIGAVWLAGVAALLLRLLGGVATLTIWTARATTVTHPLWRAALDRAVAGGRRPRLMVSPRIASPLSWGWPGGVILIDEATLSRPDRADAVLTHEMGHIRHHDWLFLMLSHALVAALWFNPFIWRLRTELARQSEQAADAWAVRRIDRADYADVLVAMARGARPHAALGMAGSSSDLARRITAVLDASRGKSRPWSTAAVAVACLGVAGPLAALEWRPDARPATPGSPVAAHMPRATPTTAAAVVALMPTALAGTDVPPPARSLSPEALAAAIRQRDLGLAMFEAGARAVEAGAAQIHQHLSQAFTAEERESMVQEAEGLAREADDLRRQARELAARDPATLTPMSAAEVRELENQLQSLRALPGQIQAGFAPTVGINANVEVNARTGFPPRTASPTIVIPDPPPPPREAIAAGMREGAGKMRADAARMDAEVSRIEQDRSQPQEARDNAERLREQAQDLRGQADDLDGQANDVLND